MSRSLDYQRQNTTVFNKWERILKIWAEGKHIFKINSILEFFLFFLLLVLGFRGVLCLIGLFACLLCLFFVFFFGLFPLFLRQDIQHPQATLNFLNIGG